MRVQEPDGAPAVAEPRRFLLVANPSSGTNEDRALIDRAGQTLNDVETALISPTLDLRGAIAAGVAKGRIVVAAGGDGTINAVAQHLVGTAGVLGVLPAGTLNHFARDLGVSDPDVAMKVLAEGVPRPVDVGTASGRHFLNNAVVGLYPEAVRERRRVQHRVGKWPGLALGWAKVLARARPLSGTVTADGDGRSLFAWTVFVANNRVSTTPGRFGERDRLDEGVLDLHVVLAKRGARGRYSLARRTIRPHPWGWGRRVRRQASSLRVELRKPRPCAVDGELQDPVRSWPVQIVPRSLNVLVPGPGSWTRQGTTE